MLYEIDMLRYTAQKLIENLWQTEMDKWMCLEAFLVHFRNLIEFFGHPRPRTDDLHISRIDVFWPDAADAARGCRATELAQARPMGEIRNQYSAENI